ncbi:SDR family NAD(P)-dependent oxidoreductase [Gluconacetobacter takamatsuzukensis]|uniref:SDR family oxidoreductase n=1 Tax=Gluconacetobacter takamatsuzukensis TaxID=1286190 RepID=A0A7W4KDH8_9PROT|nr:SDR family NAD(P)-dependent oxidoreductase [Gluconacetobacter takamatsuzukensis]MBB2204972.1 SDR family oxidoreductase [Gluconacetobacter takamatsuzukensis]
MKILSGRKALVTGAGSGIGRECALALAGAGALVLVNDVSESAAHATCTAIAGAGGTAHAHVASVADPDAVHRLFEQFDAEGNAPDILVNNAGVSGNGPTLDLADANWMRVVGINLNGPFYCSRAAGLRMRAAGGGTIVNIGSIYSVVAAPQRLSYCTTKAAIGMMTKCLALEWAEFGIRVNCVAPGYVDSALTRELAATGRLDLAAVERRIPQHRLGQASEIADAVLYLCEPRSAHITGHILTVDGGWTANGYL